MLRDSRPALTPHQSQGRSRCPRIFETQEPDLNAIGSLRQVLFGSIVLR
jgi:hypothetical protein